MVLKKDTSTVVVGMLKWEGSGDASRGEAGSEKQVTPLPPRSQHDVGWLLELKRQYVVIITWI